jgi:hypothetical protein
MFSKEVCVVLEDEPGREIASIFVHRGLVRTESKPRRGRPVPGLLRVSAARDGNLFNVFLPAETIEHGWVIGVVPELIVA